MKRAAVILGLAALLAGASAWGQVPVPAYKARVVDLTGSLSAAQSQALESSLREFEQRKGSQIAVLIVPSVRPETIEQYSIRVAEAWKSGRRNVDDGAIIVVAKNDREARIEVARGLEGAVPDILASRIGREIMVPHFQNGDYYGGIAEAARALMKLVDGEPLPAPARGAAPAGRDIQGTFVILLILAFLGGGILSRLLGRGGGAIGTGGIVGFVAWVLTGTLVLAGIAGFIAFVFTLAGGGTGARHRGGWGGPWGGGGWGGGGFGGGGGGGFGGGGGGSFGGGGASVRW